MSNSSIQFKGKDAIIQAYEFNKVGPWAIFVGRELMFSCDDRDFKIGSGILEDVLDHLIDGHSEGAYQLRIYRDVPPKGIMSNTPYSYSFKFRLYSDEEFDKRNPFNNSINQIMQRLDSIEKGKDEEEEEVDNSIGGRIGRMLERPEVQNALLGRLLGFMDAFTNRYRSASPSPMGSANGHQTMAETTTQQEQPTNASLYEALAQDERDKLDQALYVLMQNDPQVGTHLLKLATLLVTQPKTYEMLCKM